MKIKFPKLLFLYVILILGYFSLLAYPYLSSKITRFSSLGFLSLVEEKTEDIKKADSDGENLLKGEKITGKLLATERNLGIVLVRFTQLTAKVTDTVIFRIKQEGQEQWYYENNYHANQFQSDEYYTFGFPPIVNSKNKVYIFEVESLSGTGKNGIGLSPKKPQVALVFKYAREDLKNINTLFSFFSKKFIYVTRNADLLGNWQFLVVLVLSLFFILRLRKKRSSIAGTIRVILSINKSNTEIRIKTLKIISKGIKSNYMSIRKQVIKFSKKITNYSKKQTQLFTSTKFYLLFLATNTRKRIAIGLLIFLIAFLYRFSASLIDQPGVSLFYAGLGGQGDYDQFIRASTCAIREFCSLTIHQNLLIESFILSSFYGLFGFAGGLEAYVYLMLITSSIVATLPYLLLSRKTWISIGGIIGSLFLATSEFLTQVALNFPPDNGSTFTFSMFFLVYLLTLHFGTIRWLLLFGFIGFFDGMFKALFLLNDLVAFVLFIPVFFYEKARKAARPSGKQLKSMFQKKNIKILFLSSLPLLVFLILYSAWEYFVYIKFSAYYFLRGLILSGGESYTAYTAFDNGSLAGGLLVQLLNLSVSAIVMIKRLIQYADLPIIFLATIFSGTLLFSFIKLPRRTKFPIVKFIVASILSVVIVVLLIFIKNDYFNIHQIFAGEYIIDNWTDQTYIGIFLFVEIVILFILNFGYQALKLSLPIVPYVIMLIILTKNSPFPRISTHVVVWSIILFSFLLSWLLLNISLLSKRKTKDVIGYALLILFIVLYILPKTSTMVTRLYSGIDSVQRETKYLQWVNSSLPDGAIILAGGKSDLVQVAGNIKRPVVYNTSWVTALLIEPNKIPGISPTDFSLVNELQNEESFKKNKYFILEEDIDLWINRIQGVADGVFSASPSASTLSAEDYSINVYKSNPTLKKAIYELTTR